MKNLKNIVMGAFLGLVMVFCLLAASPAQAAISDGDIRHYSPDTGYDRPILIRCDFGDPDTNKFLYEGQHSTAVCGADTDRVYVRSGEHLVCKYQDTSVTVDWRVPKDSDGISMAVTGWHKIDGWWKDGYGCVLKLDG